MDKYTDQTGWMGITIKNENGLEHVVLYDVWDVPNSDLTRPDVSFL